MWVYKQPHTETSKLKNHFFVTIHVNFLFSSEITMQAQNNAIASQ